MTTATAATIERGYLLQAAAQVVRALPSKQGHIPILDMAHFNVQSDRLTLTATDLATACRVTVPLYLPEPVAPFQVCAPAAPLVEWLKGLADYPVTLAATGDHALALGQQRGRAASRFSLHGKPAADYPVVPDVAEGAQIIIIDAGALSVALNGVLPFVSKDEVRAACLHLKLAWGIKGLTFTACDGRRFCERSVAVQWQNTRACAAAPYTLLNAAAAANIARACSQASKAGNGSATVRLSMDAHSIVVDVAGAQWLTTAVEDCGQSFPRLTGFTASYAATVQRKPLHDAVRRLQKTAGRNGVELTLKQGGLLEVAAYGESGEPCREELCADGPTAKKSPAGLPPTISLPAKSLLAALKPRLKDDSDTAIEFGNGGVQVEGVYIVGEETEAQREVERAKRAAAEKKAARQRRAEAQAAADAVPVAAIATAVVEHAAAELKSNWLATSGTVWFAPTLESALAIAAQRLSPAPDRAVLNQWFPADLRTQVQARLCAELATLGYLEGADRLLPPLRWEASILGQAEVSRRAQARAAAPAALEAAFSTRHGEKRRQQARAALDAMLETGRWDCYRSRTMSHAEYGTARDASIAALNAAYAAAVPARGKRPISRRTS